MANGKWLMVILAYLGKVEEATRAGDVLFDLGGQGGGGGEVFDGP